MLLHCLKASGSRTEVRQWIGIAVGFYFIYTLQDYGRARAEERIDDVARRLGGFAESGRKQMGRLSGKRRK